MKLYFQINNGEPMFLAETNDSFTMTIKEDPEYDARVAFEFEDSDGSKFRIIRMDKDFAMLGNEIPGLNEEGMIRVKHI